MRRSQGGSSAADADGGDAQGRSTIRPRGSGDSNDKSTDSASSSDATSGQYNAQSVNLAEAEFILAAATGIRDHLKQQRVQQLRESGINTDRVLKSASGTAKYTMHQQYLAHAIGFGTDSRACKLMPLFWRSEWPEAMERSYALLLQLEYGRHRSLVAEEHSIWSRVFADRVASGLPDGSFGIGCACVPSRSTRRHAALLTLRAVVLASRASQLPA